MKRKNIHHYSRLTDKRPSIVEGVIETERNFSKKPVFEKGNADGSSELPSVSNNSILNSSKMRPKDASEKSNEKEVCPNLRDDRIKQKPK